MGDDLHEMDAEDRFAELDERQLIEAAKADARALAVLYRQHYAAVFGYVQRRIGNSHDTNDIVSDVFISMVHALSRFRWNNVPFRCWLLRLATTQIGRWVRKRKFSRLWQPFREDLASSPESKIHNNEQTDLVRKSMLALPDRFQTVLALHYFEDLSIVEISKVLECRPGTVKSRLSRGRDLLRKKLELLDRVENQDEQRTIRVAPENAEI